MRSLDFGVIVDANYKISVYMQGLYAKEISYGEETECLASHPA
jgi:hypothetical protein